MFIVIASIIIAVRLVLVFKFLNKPQKPPILGVYQQPSKYYYLKFITFYIFLKIKQLINHVKRFLKADKEKLYDGTLHIEKDDLALEEKFQMSDHPKAVDAIYFNGLSQDGTAIVCNIARRPRNFCDSFFYVKIAGKELLLSPELPDTRQKQDVTDEGEYRINGLSAVNYMPMRSWMLNFDGQMKPQNDLEKRVAVQAKLVWSAKWAPFNYNTDMSPWSLANDVARETWSRDYFDLLKKFHQTHYEQMGAISGTVTIDGVEHSVDVPCVRDHSFGPFRDWKTFHRYVLHFTFLENGDCLAVGTVSQPAILSHLTIGYYCRKSDQRVFPVHSSDFLLYQHGESQQMPTDYGFSFEAGDETYVVRYTVYEETQFYIGEERESKFYERWCSVQLNDVKGWACTEWQYNSVQEKSKPKKQA